MIRLAQGDEWKRSASFVRGFHPFNAFLLPFLHLLPLVRLVIVAGPASPHIYIPFPSIPSRFPSSLSSVATLRAPAAMGDPKWSCWRSAIKDPQVILMAFLYLEDYKYMALEGASLSSSFESTLLMSPGWASLHWHCGFATTSSSSTSTWTRTSERILRGLWVAAGFVSLRGLVFSPRPVVVKLRMRSPLPGTATSFTRMLCSWCSFPPTHSVHIHIPYSSLPLPRHLVTSIHSMAPRQCHRLPFRLAISLHVYTQ